MQETDFAGPLVFLLLFGATLLAVCIACLSFEVGLCDFGETRRFL